MIRLRGADIVDIALQLPSPVKLVKATLHRQGTGRHRLVLTVDDTIGARVLLKSVSLRGEVYSKPIRVDTTVHVYRSHGQRAGAAVWEFMREK